MPCHRSPTLRCRWCLFSVSCSPRSLPVACDRCRVACTPRALAFTWCWLPLADDRTDCLHQKRRLSARAATAILPAAEHPAHRRKLAQGHAARAPRLLSTDNSVNRQRTTGHQQLVDTSSARFVVLISLAAGLLGSDMPRVMPELPPTEKAPRQETRRKPLRTAQAIVLPARLVSSLPTSSSLPTPGNLGTDSVITGLPN